VRALRYFKFALIGLSVIGLILCFVYKLYAGDVHAWIVIAGCAGPAGLAGYFTFVEPGMPRWAAVTSAVVLLVVGMKTSGDDTDINNIMMAAFFGMIAAIVLAIRPEKR
jgi:hypothetical protein